MENDIKFWMASAYEYSQENKKLTEINKILMDYVNDIENSNMETNYKLRAYAVKHQIKKIEVDYEN
jgi:hypothetical protein